MKTYDTATDVLIIGSGLAGLLLALELSELDAEVTLVCKSTLFHSNTSKAQGGLAAVVDPGCSDSPALHLQDTLIAGAGLTDAGIASLILKEGNDLVKRLSTLGVHFDRAQSGEFELALEGGHSRGRVLHAKDTTGNTIAGALIARVQEGANIHVLENTPAIDLIVENNCCIGAKLLIEQKETCVFAHHVVLASGGVGQIFERTSNPEIATGDGIAMAWRAGAVLSDLEFVQFHPTTLHKAGAPSFLISEAVRGAGAILLDGNLQPFARRFHSAGELATRDVVSRAIWSVMAEQSIEHVWLDMRPLGRSRILEQFPNIVGNCQRWGIDPLTEPVAVSPAAHFFMGGIWTNANGCTTVPGLYALGECAALGLHGANRLASNSLLECGVMAMRIARDFGRRFYRGTPAVSPAPELHSITPLEQRLYSISRQVNRQALVVPRDMALFRHMMYKFAGIRRNEKGLTHLLEYLSESTESRLGQNQSDYEAANMLLLGQLIVLSALSRQESRGAHWRSDYPDEDNRQFLKRQFIRIDDIASCRQADIQVCHGNFTGLA